MESNEEGASTTDNNVMELSESGNTNNSDLEKREDRVHIVQELETVDTSQELESFALESRRETIDHRGR